MQHLSELKIQPVLYLNARPNSEQIATLCNLNISVIPQPYGSSGNSGDQWVLQLHDSDLTTSEPINPYERHNREIKYLDKTIINLKLNLKFNHDLGKFDKPESPIFRLEIEENFHDFSKNYTKQISQECLANYTKDVNDRRSYASIQMKYSLILAEYENKLKNDLRRYQTRNGALAAKPGPKSPPVDQLTYKKWELVRKARTLLERNGNYHQDNIEQMIALLQKNRETLKERRDSWLVDKIKIVGSLGSILLYRYLMGDEVTRGMKNLNSFIKDYSKSNPEYTPPSSLPTQGLK